MRSYHRPSEEEDNVSATTEQALAFLDTWSVVYEDGSIKSKLYRTETHEDKHLHITSNPPLEHKKGVVKTLMQRLDTIMSDERDKVEEITCETGPYYKWPPEWLIINSIPTIQPSLESTTSVSGDDNSDVHETEIETINKKPTSKKSVVV